MKATKKQKVLFLCTANSARSQMAQALLTHKAGELYDVYSAGTAPETVDARAIAALEKFGVEVSALKSKNVTVFENQRFDYVITLCNNANNEHRSYPNTVKQLAWDFPDPKTRSGSDPFMSTLHELNNRLAMFLLVETKNVYLTDNTENNSLSIADNTEVNLDLISFYKSLADNIRLKTLMLTHYHGELCVCELMVAMQEDSQPKVSRNLAVLKNAQVITARKHGQWVFYRINPKLPLWAKLVIAQTSENNISLINNELERLSSMQNRPDKVSFCK